MPGITFTIDPAAVPLAFIEANGIHVLSPAKFKRAVKEKLWASNIDTEGEKAAGHKTSNAELTLPVRLTGASEEQSRERQVAVEEKIHKLDDEGGVLRVTFPDGEFADWEIRAVSCGEKLLDNAFLHSWRTQDEITFVLAPYGEGEEELVGEYEFAGAAKRLLECIVPDVKGSEEAVARAVVTSPEADLWDLKWGRESRYLSEAPTAKPLYAANELTPKGGAVVTTATVDGVAGTSVVRQTLSPNWTAGLSTQISGVGQMTQIGTYEVLVWVHMPAGNTGEVGIGFEYGVGDLLRRTSLDPIYFPANHSREGKVIQLKVGEVTLLPSGAGTHQWEGQVIAKSLGTGDILDILDIALRPLSEGNGSVSVEPAFNQPAALMIRDEFNQTAGNLNGKQLAAIGAVAGPSAPTVTAEDAAVGTKAWTNIANAKAIDGVWAAASGISTGAITKYLKATKLGFSIPEGATIVGIEVTIKKRESVASGPFIRDSSVKLAKAGAITGSEHALAGLWSKEGFTSVYGSPTDLWGTTWTPAQINAEGFGIAIAATNTTAASSSTAEIDGFTVTIYYSDTSGQSWVTSGDAVDLAVEATGHTAQRSEVSDADINTGRYAVAGTTVLTDTAVGIRAKRGALKVGASERIRGGSMARYVDTSNWLYFGPDVEAPSSPVTDTMRVLKRVAGTVTELDKVTIPDSVDWRSVYLVVDRRGRYFCWATLLESGIPRLLSVGQDNDLATGGALDDGKLGFQDAKTGANANTRNYDQFVAWVPPLDAVIYKGLSLELTHDACRREGETGSWASVTPSGDYLRLAPAGMENRKNRLVFVASPHDPDTMGVGFPKKLKVAVYAKPRYRTIPDPA